jgi:hypothetical protein
MELSDAPEKKSQWPGIDPGTLRLVGKCLNPRPRCLKFFSELTRNVTEISSEFIVRSASHNKWLKFLLHVNYDSDYSEIEKKYKTMECDMSIKIHFLRLTLGLLPWKLWRLQWQIPNMKKQYQGKYVGWLLVNPRERCSTDEMQHKIPQSHPLDNYRVWKYKILLQYNFKSLENLAW